MLVEDLISANPIVDLGYRIILERQGGWIEKNGKVITTLRREQLRWLVNLNELRCLNATIVKKETTGPHTKELVIQLHRRMGHASTKVMTDALKAGAWTNCGITTDEVTGVMSSYVCPICLLAKRNQTKMI